MSFLQVYSFWDALRGSMQSWPFHSSYLNKIQSLTGGLAAPFHHSKSSSLLCLYPSSNLRYPRGLMLSPGTPEMVWRQNFSRGNVFGILPALWSAPFQPHSYCSPWLCVTDWYLRGKFQFPRSVIYIQQFIFILEVTVYSWVRSSGRALS